MITYREKAGVMASKVGGHNRIHVYIEGRFAGKIELIYPQHNQPRWRYLPNGHRRLAGAMFETLEECKRSLENE